MHTRLRGRHHAFSLVERRFRRVDGCQLVVGENHFRFNLDLGQTSDVTRPADRAVRQQNQTLAITTPGPTRERIGHCWKPVGRQLGLRGGRTSVDVVAGQCSGGGNCGYVAARDVFCGQDGKGRRRCRGINRPSCRVNDGTDGGWN